MKVLLRHRHGIQLNMQHRTIDQIALLASFPMLPSAESKQLAFHRISSANVARRRNLLPRTSRRRARLQRPAWTPRLPSSPRFPRSWAMALPLPGRAAVSAPCLLKGPCLPASGIQRNRRAARDQHWEAMSWRQGLGRCGRHGAGGTWHGGERHTVLGAIEAVRYWKADQRGGRGGRAGLRVSS